MFSFESYHGTHVPLSQMSISMFVLNLNNACIAILVVYLGIAFIWKVFLSQVNSSDLDNNKFHMVLKYSRYGLNNVHV